MEAEQQPTIWISKVPDNDDDGKQQQTKVYLLLDNIYKLNFV